MQGSGLSQGLAGCDIWAEKQAKGQPQPYRAGAEHSLVSGFTRVCCWNVLYTGYKGERVKKT